MNATKIPQTDSIQELADFWQSHDLNDFEDELEEVIDTVFARKVLVSAIGKEKNYMSVAEIETAITQLSNNDVAALLTWLEEYHAQLWDEQIEQDLEAGRLDALLEQVDKEYEAGLSKPL